MPAKILLLKTGLLAAGVAAATAIWASMPDSMVQNSLVDPLRAWSAKGRWVELSDNQPLGNRRPIVVVLGMNNSTDTHGPSEEVVKKTLALPMATCQGIYWDRTGRELYQDSKWYCYWYNHNRYTDEQLAQWLRMWWEKDPDLTRNIKEVELIGHSRGVRIIADDYTKTQGRKIDQVIGLAGALRGGPLSVRENIERGLGKAFGYVGEQLNKAVSAVAKFLGIEFDAKGTQELQPSNTSHWVLDGNWHLLAGSVDVSDQSVVHKAFNLTLAGDQVFARLTGSGAPQDATYYQATALAIESLGLGPNDGMVTETSAHAKGIVGAEKAQKITLSNHNHSEMLLGNGGIELWSQVMEILIPRILPQASQVSNFDLWLPELPETILLPQANDTSLINARLAFDNANGEIWIAEANGAPVKLGLGNGRFSWPQWSGNDLVATRRQRGDTTDIVLAQASNGKMIQLTTDGKSELAGVSDDGQLIAYVSGGNLLLRDKGGVGKVLVQGLLSLDSPPVLMNDKVYFAVKQGEDYSLYAVNVGEKQLAIGQAELVAQDVRQPIKIGTGLLAMRPMGDSIQWTAVSVFGVGLFNRKIDELLGTLEQPNIPSVTMIDVDEASFSTDVTSWDIYLVADEQIRRLELARDTGTWDEVAPVIALGLHLDVK